MDAPSVAFGKKDDDTLLKGTSRLLKLIIRAWVTHDGGE